MTKQILTLVIGLGMAIGGCARPEAPQRAAVGELPAESFARQWVADLDLVDERERPGRQDRARALHIRDNVVYLYTRNNNVYALSREGGHLQYSADVTDRRGRLHPPVLFDDRVIFPTTLDLKVYDHRGRHLDSVRLRYASRSGAAAMDPHIYIGQDYPEGGRVVQIELDRPYGQVRWELMTFGGVSSTPAIHRGVIYAASEDGGVYAMDPHRRRVWPIPDGIFRTGGRVTADLAVDDLGVYVASTDSILYCLSPDTGRIRWQYHSGQPLTDAPVVTDHTVYQFVPRTGLTAIDKAAGPVNRTPRWIARDAVQFLAEDEQYAYLRRSDNRIMAVDLESGETRFTSRRSDFAVFASNTEDAVIFASTRGGQVMAIRPVLRPGAVGEMVLAPVDESAEAIEMIAAAR